jgi:hypothetical protein
VGICGIAHANAHAIARHPRLGHFEERPANPVAIADTNLIVGKADDSQIFAKLDELKVMSLKVGFPVSVRVELIHDHGAMLSAVPLQVALPVAIEVKAASHHPARHRTLPDSSAHYFTLPIYVTRKTDVH